jgi:hypothetical protein
MYISDPQEVEAVFAFFQEHLGNELEITISAFEGLIEWERMLVTEVAQTESRIVLSGIVLSGRYARRKLLIDPHHYSFATVSPDQTKLEIGRILGSGITMRITASQIS